MKKTLVALAALSAISAFAQSSVVIDGYFDRGYTSLNSNADIKDLKTVASSAGTTTVGIKVREDLGGGLSVGGSVNTDWADFGGASQSNAAGTAQTGGFANSQSFVDVTDAKLGTLRLGAPNSFTLTNATAVASPAYSTGIGSAYSSSFSIANGLGTGSAGKGGLVDISAIAASKTHKGQRAIRIANSVQYSSPVVLGGLSVHVGYTPQNNNDTTTFAAATPNTNSVGAKEFALRYTNGPLDAMYTSIKYTVGGNALSAGAGTSSTNNLAGMSSTQNLLGATYTVMPALKLHAGYGTFGSDADQFKGSSKQFGATYTTGAWVISAQQAKVTDEGTGNSQSGGASTAVQQYDRKLTGAGVDYNLSKTARVYARYDNINYATNAAAFTADAGSTQKRYAIGVSKSF